MIRETGKPPEGSSVAIYSEEGRVTNEARPDWSSMASNERTWTVLDLDSPGRVHENCRKERENRGAGGDSLAPPEGKRSKRGHRGQDPGPADRQLWRQQLEAL